MKVKKLLFLHLRIYLRLGVSTVDCPYYTLKYIILYRCILLLFELLCYKIKMFDKILSNYETCIRNNIILLSLIVY